MNVNCMAELISSPAIAGRDILSKFIFNETYTFSSSENDEKVCSRIDIGRSMSTQLIPAGVIC